MDREMPSGLSGTAPFSSAPCFLWWPYALLRCARKACGRGQTGQERGRTGWDGVRFRERKKDKHKSKTGDQNRVAFGWWLRSRKRSGSTWTPHPLPFFGPEAPNFFTPCVSGSETFTTKPPHCCGRFSPRIGASVAGSTTKTKHAEERQHVFSQESCVNCVPSFPWCANTSPETGREGLELTGPHKKPEHDFWRWATYRDVPLFCYILHTSIVRVKSSGESRSS